MCSLSNINSSIKHTYYSLSLDLHMYGLFKKYFVKIKNLYSPPMKIKLLFSIYRDPSLQSAK